MGNYVRFLVLMTVRVFSQIFFRHRLEWITPPPADLWSRLRVVNVLNHTSLYEWLYAGTIPVAFLWRIASHALVPMADKTMNRPVVGRFLRTFAPRYVSITRESDDTWSEVLRKIDDTEPMVIIFPEGRMKRADGLDKNGQPMTVRGGIADILRAVPEGLMAIVYSGGLHHVQAPGQIIPKPFGKLRLRIEVLEIADYVALVERTEKATRFKGKVRRDLERRRDHHCGELEAANGIVYDR